MARGSVVLGLPLVLSLFFLLLPLLPVLALALLLLIVLLLVVLLLYLLATIRLALRPSDGWRGCRRGRRGLRGRGARLCALGHGSRLCALGRGAWLDTPSIRPPLGSFPGRGSDGIGQGSIRSSGASPFHGRRNLHGTLGRGHRPPSRGPDRARTPHLGILAARDELHGALFLGGRADSHAGPGAFAFLDGDSRRGCWGDGRTVSLLDDLDLLLEDGRSQRWSDARHDGSRHDFRRGPGGRPGQRLG